MTHHRMAKGPLHNKHGCQVTEVIPTVIETSQRLDLVKVVSRTPDHFRCILHELLILFKVCCALLGHHFSI